MHRDTKIGLALAILLIGFGAAFCFPRVDSCQTPVSIELEGAAELDRVIERLPLRAYTEPVIVVDAANSVPAAATELPASPTFGPQDLLSPAQSIGSLSEPSALLPAPDPIQADEPVIAAPLGDPFEAIASEEDGAYITHHVQSGETLSELASRYLGSVTRYPEIFEANRDILKSPDDLRLNMPLRIPRRSARADDATPR